MNAIEIVNNIFSVDKESFPGIALQVFYYQYQNNTVYQQWVDYLKVNPLDISDYTKIPFLPVSVFKTHSVITGKDEPQVIFESSGTTQTINSQHLVKDVALYRNSFMKGFTMFYGEVKKWCIIGLLPSYLERKNSSLVMMVDELIRQSKHEQSGFYLYDYAALHEILLDLEKQQQPTLVIGVTFALLNFIDHYKMKLQHTIIMETGGMKGRREEMIRPQVHAALQEGFGIERIHSEYGMTELLSQAYSTGDGIFKTVPWMKVLVRDEDDPFHIKKEGRGVINVIDLANLYSCSFIATDDAATLYNDGTFEVLGRVDNSDIRGCSLMVV